jgi:uncharacterized membrane protein YvbJ
MPKLPPAILRCSKCRRRVAETAPKCECCGEPVDLHAARAMAIKVEQQRKMRKGQPLKNVDVVILAVLAITAVAVFVYIFKSYNHGNWGVLFRRPVDY